MFSVCLVGYTNAGKSTLMNLLTGAGVLAEDQLFATLDTKTAPLEPGRRPGVPCSATPSASSATCRTTWWPASAPRWRRPSTPTCCCTWPTRRTRSVDRQIAAVDAVLDELDCQGKDQLLLLNKIDRLQDPTVLAALQARYGGALCLSAATGQGADRLVAEVIHRLQHRRVALTLRADVRNGRLMQYLARHAQVRHQEWSDNTVEMDAVMATEQADRLAQFAPDVHVLQRSAATA